MIEDNIMEISQKEYRILMKDLKTLDIVQNITRNNSWSEYTRIQLKGLPTILLLLMQNVNVIVKSTNLIVDSTIVRLSIQLLCICWFKTCEIVGFTCEYISYLHILEETNLK